MTVIDDSSMSDADYSGALTELVSFATRDVDRDGIVAYLPTSVDLRLEGPQLTEETTTAIASLCQYWRIVNVASLRINPFLVFCAPDAFEDFLAAVTTDSTQVSVDIRSAEHRGDVSDCVDQFPQYCRALARNARIIENVGIAALLEHAYEEDEVKALLDGIVELMRVLRIETLQWRGVTGS